MKEEFTRTEMLLGRDAVKTLEKARVAVFGLGGVGGYTVEALARAGVGSLVLVDKDTVSAKLALIERAKETGIPIISCMGTGNKLDASAFQVADISKTAVCPLARVMRRELGKRGIRHLKVVYSREEAWKPSGWEEEAAALGKRQIPGSVSFVPGAAGLLLAGEVIRDLTGYSRM